MLSCIGVSTSESISVMFHFFGFSRATLPTDPEEEITEVSILKQIKSLQGKHIHLNIIRVGIDNFTATEVEKIDYAIFKIRIFTGRLV